MIIIKVISGLGNQFFQYSFGRALSTHHNVPLKLDISWYENNPDHLYQLDHFNIKAEVASDSEIKRVKYGENNILNKVINRIQRFLPYYKQRKIKQRTGGFDRKIFLSPKTVYFSGYWGSEKYFKNIESQILNELTLKDDLDQVNLINQLKIQKAESVSLHIRRGDYLLDFNARVFNILSLEYYYRAIEDLVKVVKQPFFFIFSDDMDWVQDNLKINYPHEFISNNSHEKAFFDLFLMSECKHHIIANSTFSWWGAWLCKNPQKKIYAPLDWYSDPTKNTRDLIPPNWSQI